MIVYSYTHNTLRLIQEWAEHLNQHAIEIASIHAYDENPNTKAIHRSRRLFGFRDLCERLCISAYHGSVSQANPQSKGSSLYLGLNPVFSF